MKSIKRFLLMVLAVTVMSGFGACSKSSDSGLIKVGIINNPPSESGYRAANVADFTKVFTKENGYDVSTFYSLKNDEQLNAANQFITNKVDFILLSAAATDGWDAVLKSAKEAGIKVFLFDRMLNADPSLYEAAVVSD
ncbi:MAG TPA: substrate-binding domain-containing protein, partial [Spirochaetota bacterium]|nr:substrate-binding domain-containing protein [Spirochaetota bacterium]